MLFIVFHLFSHSLRSLGLGCGSLASLVKTARQGLPHGDLCREHRRDGRDHSGDGKHKPRQPLVLVVEVLRERGDDDPRHSAHSASRGHGGGPDVRGEDLGRVEVAVVRVESFSRRVVSLRQLLSRVARLFDHSGHQTIAIFLAHIAVKEQENIILEIVTNAMKTAPPAPASLGLTAAIPRKTAARACE